MKRGLIALGVLAFILAAGWLASLPLHTLMVLREAIARGDTETLRERVDWVRVRETLKLSLGERSEARLGGGSETRPGLWRRTRDAVRPAIERRLIERYVTPEGAPRLFTVRHTWRESVAPRIGLGRRSTTLEGTPLAGTALDRLVTFLSHVERVAYASLDRFEIDVRDRFLTDRRLALALERRGLTWRLVEVFVLPEPAEASDRTATKLRGAI